MKPKPDRHARIVLPEPFMVNHEEGEYTNIYVREDLWPNKGTFYLGNMGRYKNSDSITVCLSLPTYLNEGDSLGLPPVDVSPANLVIYLKSHLTYCRLLSQRAREMSGWYTEEHERQEL